MEDKIRLLIIEDNENDALLIIRHLKKEGFHIQYDIIDSKKSMVNALSKNSWDAVLCDYSLPDFNGFDVLELIRKKDSDTPVILISGTIGEEIAIKAMKLGANDYIMKDNMIRLAPSLKREIKEAKNRTEKKRSDVRLKESEERYKELFDNISSGAAVFEAIDHGKDFIFKDFNNRAEEIEKIKKEKLIGKKIKEVFPGAEQLGLLKVFRRVYKTGKPVSYKDKIYEDKEGKKSWRDNYVYKLSTGEIISVYRDVTEKKEAEDSLKESYKKINRVLSGTIDALGNIIESRDPYTAGHQIRVTRLAVCIAEELNLDTKKIEAIRIASKVHDIGKIVIPQSILNKPGTINDIEYELIKSHVQAGYEILKGIEFEQPIADIVLQHHERMNGSGYPNGLKSDKIILEAKIIGVADVVEAMSSHRPYRPALGTDKSLREISSNSGTFYDKAVVKACLNLFKNKKFKFD